MVHRGLGLALFLLGACGAKSEDIPAPDRSQKVTYECSPVERGVDITFKIPNYTYLRVDALLLPNDLTIEKEPAKDGTQRWMVRLTPSALQSAFSDNSINVRYALDALNDRQQISSESIKCPLLNEDKFSLKSTTPPLKDYKSGFSVTLSALLAETPNSRALQSTDDSSSFEVEGGVLDDYQIEVLHSNAKEIEVNGEKFPFTGGVAKVKLDLLAGFAAAKMKQSEVSSFNYDHLLPILMRGDGWERSGAISVNGPFLRFLAEKIKRGPVRFPEEVERPDNKRSLLLISSSGLSQFFGGEERHDSLDLIGIHSSAEKLAERCEYVDSAGKKSSSDAYSSTDTITVYARRTGKKLGSKTFKNPSPGCKAVIAASDGNSTIRTAPSDIADFAKTFLDASLPDDAPVETSAAPSKH